MATATTTATSTRSSTSTLTGRYSDYKEPKSTTSALPPNNVSAASPEEPKTVYTPIRLAIYDFWVLGIVSTWAWGCSTVKYLLPLFRANVGANHLDIGVGTGYYLDKGRIPASTRLTLVDNEQGALNVAKIRSKRHDATAIVADILKPLPTTAKFDSVSMYYLLHCLPTTVQEKCRIFDHLKNNVAADGVVHGANVLGKGVRDDNFFAAFIRRGCTNHGVFHNKDDNAFDFEEALRRNFHKVETRVVGSVFIFWAKGPKSE